MPTNNLEVRIARLQREIERLAAQHAEQMTRRSLSANPKTREMDAKRAGMLARRVRRLGKMLQMLQRQSDDSTRGRRPKNPDG